MAAVVVNFNFCGWCCLLWLSITTATATTTVAAFASSSSSSSSSSPWSPAEWRVNLNIGREPGTCMPPEWGASGARLFLPLEVLIESERVPNAEQDFMGGGSGAFRLTVLEDPTHVTLEQGQVAVEFADRGAWKLAVTRRTAGDACRLRFWVDLSTPSTSSSATSTSTAVAARRSDVALTAGERLYLVANAWREADVRAGIDRSAPLEAAARDAQRRLDARLSHGTGDRRLDGTNPLDAALASIDVAVLVKARDDAVMKWKGAKRLLPPSSSTKDGLSAPGAWPGSTERLLIAPGTIAVKRRKGIFGGEEFHIVGTWTATPIEGLSEYVLEEDDEAEVVDP